MSKFNIGDSIVRVEQNHHRVGIKLGDVFKVLSTKGGYLRIINIITGIEWWGLEDDQYDILVCDQYFDLVKETPRCSKCNQSLPQVGISLTPNPKELKKLKHQAMLFEDVRI